MINIELNKLVYFKDLQQDCLPFLSYICELIPLPTEYVVTDFNQQKTPRIARTYRTNHYSYDNSFLDCQELIARVQKLDGKFEGTSKYNELIMIEVWSDNGSDGHIRHPRQIHVYVYRSSLQYPDREYDNYCLNGCLKTSE